MGFTEVQSLDADNTTAIGGVNKKTGKKNPLTAEGYYLGSRKVESRKAKSGYAYLHILQTPKGNLGVWGKTDMDRKLTTVAPGTMVRITHTGMQATPNGDMYKFKVEVDSSNSIEVGNLGNDSFGGVTEDGNEDSYGDNEEVSAEVAGDDYQSEALVASRQQHVQGLLDRGKRKQ